MKTMYAKYPGRCSGCGTEIKKGTKIAWGRKEGAYHYNCKPSHNTRADAEYYAGIRDVERYRENKRWFGDEMAEAMEIEREMREGWDY